MKRHSVNNPCVGLVISICSNSNHLISLIPPKFIFVCLDNSARGDLNL